jgi:hypothetical protein
MIRRLGPTIEQAGRAVAPAQTEREPAGQGHRAHDPDDERVHDRGGDAELTERNDDGEHPHCHLRDGGEEVRAAHPGSRGGPMHRAGQRVRGQAAQNQDDQRDREIG